MTNDGTKEKMNDKRVDTAYDQLPGATPSAHIDAKILAAARDAVAGDDNHPNVGLSRYRWIGLAATVVLAIGVLLNIPGMPLAPTTQSSAETADLDTVSEDDAIVVTADARQPASLEAYDAVTPEANRVSQEVGLERRRRPLPPPDAIDRTAGFEAPEPVADTELEMLVSAPAIPAETMNGAQQMTVLELEEVSEESLEALKSSASSRESARSRAATVAENEIESIDSLVDKVVDLWQDGKEHEAVLMYRSLVKANPDVEFATYEAQFPKDLLAALAEQTKPAESP
ncbi:MAG: hypothetical protein AAAFM81_06360 [Pseudomonadota bacterium]